MAHCPVQAAARFSTQTCKQPGVDDGELVQPKSSQSAHARALHCGVVLQSNSGIALGGGCQHVGGQHGAHAGGVRPNLSVLSRRPAVRPGVATEAHVTGALLGASHLAALQLVADVRLGGAHAELAAQRVVQRVVFVVLLRLVAGEQLVAKGADERLLLVEADRADDASQNMRVHCT